MDRIRYVVLMSCHHESKLILGEWTLFEKTQNRAKNTSAKDVSITDRIGHNGKYVKVIDWEKNRVIRFVDLIS